VERALTNLAKKLGVQPGDTICLLGAPPEAEVAIREATPDGVRFFDALESKGYHLILFWPVSAAGLVEHFASYQDRILPEGAIWAVIPKKKYAARRGVSLTWEELQTAGLATDLVDNKVVTITSEDYGTRFVIRKERRINHGQSA
jgi:hypothetical protein